MDAGIREVFFFQPAGCTNIFFLQKLCMYIQIKLLLLCVLLVCMKGVVGVCVNWIVGSRGVVLCSYIPVDSLHLIFYSFMTQSPACPIIHCFFMWTAAILVKVYDIVFLCQSCCLDDG